MNSYISILALICILLLPACKLVNVEEHNTDQFVEKLEGDFEPDTIFETQNVTYSGIVQPAGISIYQQGSHRLTLPGGKFILLEAERIDLNGYVDEQVQIFGALRPTVEAGGMIMRVERIELLEDNDEAQSSQEAAYESDSSAEGPASNSSSESAASDPPSNDLSEDARVVSADMQLKIDAMATQNFAASNWTQNYCTGHISFCAPVHRNWWFKSFGATSTSLWHVEFSGEPVEKLGDGPIVINLLTGAQTSKNGTVETRQNSVTGFRTWTDNRHFEIKGDLSLEVAIRYITENIVSQ